MMAEKNEIVERPVHILVTDEDMHGTNIAKMSNFFDLYLQELSHEIISTPGMTVVQNIPIGDIQIINEVVQQADIVMQAGTEYIPDFDSLPKDIKSKIEKGIYKVGKSKQVDGNMRAVIVDENNVRVKDITLKEVVKSPDLLETTRSIANQLQMRQIYAKLADIQEMQSYQIDRDRDRDVITPFLNARNHIARAQNSEKIDDRKLYLEKAADELDGAVNAIYTDIRTTAKHLADKTAWPIFRKTKQINLYMNFLTQDMQILTKFVGIQMQVYDYLGRPADAKVVLDNFQHVMTGFISDGINKQGQSAAMLMHLNYPYIESNMDCWYKFSSELASAFEERALAIEEQKVYVISLEDNEDGTE